MHAAHAQTTAIEEIVVTAQYREQRIQDIPISMQAFSGEDLLGMRHPHAEGPREHRSRPVHE